MLKTYEMFLKWVQEIELKYIQLNTMTIVIAIASSMPKILPYGIGKRSTQSGPFSVIKNDEKNAFVDEYFYFKKKNCKKSSSSSGSFQLLWVTVTETCFWWTNFGKFANSLD